MDYVITRSPSYHNDYLSHYGVKGMKWGVRKDKPKRSSTVIRKDLDTQREVNRNMRRALRTNSITTAGALLVNATIATMGYMSPALLFAASVNAGMAAASASKLAIGSVKVSKLERELDNADD